MKKIILKVSKMSCIHCEKKIENALLSIGVKAKADAKKGVVELNLNDGVEIEKVKETIKNLGYRIA